MTVLSREPEITYLRFGLNTEDNTPSLCPLKDLFSEGSYIEDVGTFLISAPFVNVAEAFITYLNLN